ncbi:MAG: hypothetical protein QOD01_488 [Actinomycetota bacterium]|nr:hypothetical protein [Actinomycetota bacterium]
MQRGGFRAPGLSRMASGLALLLVALWAAPAISHAIFPLQQNPSGTRTNPYPAGTVQNLMMNVPEERGENPTSTVDVKVELPPGWTNPACQSALKVSGIDPGPPADGWSCAVEPGSPTLLHWSRASSSTVSAAYFPFTATTGPAGVYPFRVSQTYSSGEVVRWADPPAPNPNANPPVVCAYGQNDSGTVCLTPAPLRYVTATASPTATATPGNGYWEVAADGGTFNYGSAPFYGGTASVSPTKATAGAAASSTDRGYWLVATDGGVLPFGYASSFGPVGALRLNRPIAGMAATPTSRGYWLVGRDGGIFNFGDAAFFGSMASGRLNRPVVGMAATPTGKGYWLVAADGGIFNFGDAAFFGSAGSLRLNKPVASIAATLTGKGYWLVSTDGGVFCFGDATFFGSAGSLRLNQPMVGLVVAR